MIHIVGIGEYIVSNELTDTIKTYALASCVAVTLYSRTRKAAGMIHVALPGYTQDSHIRIKPGYYATTGVPRLIEKMSEEFGCLKKELSIQLFGGASSINKNDFFKIGAKNIEAISNVLSSMGLSYHLTEVGGNLSRTISMDVATGSIKVYTQPIRI